MCCTSIFLQDIKFVYIGHEILSKTLAKQNMQSKSEAKSAFLIESVVFRHNYNIHVDLNKRIHKQLLSYSKTFRIIGSSQFIRVNIIEFSITKVTGFFPVSFFFFFQNSRLQFPKMALVRRQCIFQVLHLKMYFTVITPSIETDSSEQSVHPDQTLQNRASDKSTLPFIQEVLDTSVGTKIDCFKFLDKV